MADASLALQKAVVAALKAAGPVTAMVAQRVYDQAPPSPPFPYITLGPGQSLPNDGSCDYRGEEHHVQIDAWSREVGFPETKALTGAIRAALHYASLTLDGHRLSHISVTAIRHLRDPDGLTSHGVVSVQAFTEPT